MIRISKRWQWTAAALLALAAALHAWWFKDLQDFGVFHRAGERAMQAAPLYVLSDGIECFKYAPVVAVLFAPFALASFKVAAFAWMVLGAGCLVLFWRWSAKTYGNEPHPLWHLLVFVWAVPYLRYLLALGQSDLIVLAVLVASELLAKKRPFASGLLWGVCVLFKLPFLILLPLALMFREWRRLTGLVVAMVVGLALPALVYGVQGNLTQLAEWRVLLATTTPQMVCAYDNQSIYGIVCRYVIAPTSSLFTPICWTLGALILAAAARVVWKRQDRAFGFAVALYLAAVLSPLGWRSNLVALIPLFYLVAARWPLAPLWFRAASVATLTLNVFVGLIVYDVVSKDAFRWLIDHKAIGILALLFVVAVLIHESKAKKESEDGRAAEA